MYDEFYLHHPNLPPHQLHPIMRKKKNFTVSKKNLTVTSWFCMQVGDKVLLLDKQTNKQTDNLPQSTDYRLCWGRRTGSSPWPSWEWPPSSSSCGQFQCRQSSGPAGKESQKISNNIRDLLNISWYFSSYNQILYFNYLVAFFTK